MKKVVVFGGSGFIGSQVCAVLLDSGYAVRVFDKKPPLQKRANLEYAQGDTLDEAAVDKAIAGTSLIYNFSGIADLDEACTKPVDTIKYNILANAYMMNSALKHKVDRLIYASTLYVYSNSGGFYRCSKQASELYIEEFHKTFGLNYTILRYGTLYGPQADLRNSVCRFLTEAIQQGTITYYGDQNSMREYIHVNDAARLSIKILEPEYLNQSVLISGHHPIRVHDLFDMIGEILGKQLKVLYKEAEGKVKDAHYKITPYSYNPKIGRKLVDHYYLDMGQGLMECIAEIDKNKVPARD